MKKLIINLIIFFVAIILLLTIGIYGLMYTLIESLFKYKNRSYINYWADLFYSINVGIDKIGNVLLAAFLNKYAIKDLKFPFGNVNYTISYVLAINYLNLNNLKPFGKWLVNVLEKIDKNHMQKSLKRSIYNY